ncbi:helix-turn-helix domain-containing protein [Kitasatospora sp. NPDC002040]|uniref:PucR family transcriptional regulator n=1 Tax=Kitasatospora sp. NPDC002040 TaxID=3154661 RepID=UPI0033297FB1
MIVGDLLTLEDLHIELAWGTAELLDRQVTGVTSTDLRDPARYLQAGELVLSGLVWWRPDDASAALRFATALRSAGVAALLAGEGTHGAVPESLVAACRLHGIPLLSVPAATSFRAVTDRVYLRLWGDLQAGRPGVAAIPETVRRELLALLAPLPAGAPLDEVLAHAVTRLGLPDCSIRTTGGRPLACSTDAPGAPVGSPVPIGGPGDCPFDGWLLQPHAAGASPALLHGLADLLAPLAVAARVAAEDRQYRAAELLARLGQDGADLSDSLAAAGLPVGTQLVPVRACCGDGPAVGALADALEGVPFAVAADGAGGAVALVAAEPAAVAARLRAAAPRLREVLTDRRPLRFGVGPAAAALPERLRGALVQAAFALEAGGEAGVGSSAELGSLAALLRGVPAEVTSAFQDRLLAPLADHDREHSVSLLDTLRCFLDHDASWSRTAEALHVHVNTVHYRIRRIEDLTGRSLSRLEDRLDLRAALLCGPLAA